MEAKNSINKLTTLVTKYQSILKSQSDRDFLLRVYRTGLEFYLYRLKAIDFVDCNHVLDAGCGFGQWSLGLSFLNKKVSGIDREKSRIEIAKKITRKLQRTNIAFLIGSIEELPYDNNTFDAIFSYSTIYQTDYYKSLSEFFRVLKTGGSVYISTNDWGWYIYNFIVNHNPSVDFNPRRYAVKTISNTIKYFITKKRGTYINLVMPLKTTVTLMNKIGLRNIDFAGEGCLIRNHDYRPKSIYPSRYLGLRSVYEVIAEK